MSEPLLTTSDYPRRALRVAIILIAIECLLLAYPSGNVLIPVILFLVAVSRLSTFRRGWCLHTPVLWNALLLTVLFVAKYTMFPVSFPDESRFANTELAHEIGCLLVALQLLILHEPLSLQRVPPAVAALGCLAILCAGDQHLKDSTRPAILCLMILFVGGLAVFAHVSRVWGMLDQRRHLRRTILLSTLAMATVPTIYAAQAWHQHEKDVEVLLLKILQVFEQSSSDRPDGMRIASLSVSDGKITDPERPVLQVIHQGVEPLYLRGAAYYSIPFRTPNWQRHELPIELNPIPFPANISPSNNENLFQIRPSITNQWNEVHVEILSRADSTLVAPLHASLIKLGASQLRMDGLDIIAVNFGVNPDTYTVYMPDELGKDEIPGEEDLVRRPHRRLDPRILALADTICDGKDTDTRKIQAIEEFFVNNFKYQLGIMLPNNEDPLTHFLIHRTPAHCEYFASGAALLLRIKGVPCRYVTGYIPSERHPGGAWIARRKDAHAWVEAYNADLERWVVVEATPAVGLPERRNATWFNANAEAWRRWRAEFMHRMTHSGIWSALSLALQSTSARIVLGLLLGLGWWSFTQRFRPQRIVSDLSGPMRTFQFQQWLQDLDLVLQEQGFVRRPQETLLQFRDRILASPRAEQLQPTAQWYVEYSSVRYNESQQTETRIADLELSWQNLKGKTARSR